MAGKLLKQRMLQKCPRLINSFACTGTYCSILVQTLSIVFHSVPYCVPWFLFLRLQQVKDSLTLQLTQQQSRVLGCCSWKMFICFSFCDRHFSHADLLLIQLSRRHDRTGIFQVLFCCYAYPAQALLHLLALCLDLINRFVISTWRCQWRRPWWRAWRAWRLRWKCGWWKRRPWARLHGASWQRWWSSKATRRQIFWGSKNNFFKVAAFPRFNCAFCVFAFWAIFLNQFYFFLMGRKLFLINWFIYLYLFCGYVLNILCMRGQFSLIPCSPGENCRWENPFWPHEEQKEQSREQEAECRGQEGVCEHFYLDE